MPIEIPVELRRVRATRKEFQDALTAANNFLLIGALFGQGDGARSFVQAFLEALRDPNVRAVCLTRTSLDGQHEAFIAIEVID